MSLVIQQLALGSHTVQYFDTFTKRILTKRILTKRILYKTILTQRILTKRILSQRILSLNVYSTEHILNILYSILPDFLSLVLHTL
jgi:hypothetical protein